jgi:hypothetical protein
MMSRLGTEFLWLLAGGAFGAGVLVTVLIGRATGRSPKAQVR